ncbi:ESX secretion-associated protein EspG [Amycolatopsis circi]|uniref:ESX secretion-associated protein EspG n=1 Tax=Amycolatopsis circi TaxID=871959 RepID=UPI000E265402|nr:ESX secretion-associated protein EspG [Amycolatopsis circi]
MTIIDRPVRMPRPAFFVAWEYTGLTTLPTVVSPDDTYATAEFAAERERRAMARFAKLGLATPDGRLTAQFRATLELLAAPARECYSWTAFTGRPEDDGAFFVAASGGDAVRLITDHRSIQLDPIRPRSLATALVEALPEYPPARMAQLRVPTVYLEDTGADPLSEMSGRADDLRHLMRAERTAVHKLHTAKNAGAERVHSTPLTVYDLTRNGRVLAFTSDTGNGGLEATVCSGNRTNLIDALNLTLDGLG